MRAATTRSRRIILRLIARGVVLLVLALIGPKSETPPAYAQPGRHPAPDGNVGVGVLGLFHPREFELSATTGQALVLQGGGETVILEKSSGIGSATMQFSGAQVLVNAGARR